MARETELGQLRFVQEDAAGAVLTANAGAHANAWNAIAVGVGGVSAVVDTKGLPFVSAFGVSSAAATITLQYSQDGTNFYDGGTVAPGAGAHFVLSAQSGARYHRLKSSAASTITATIAAKG